MESMSPEWMRQSNSCSSDKSVSSSSGLKRQRQWWARKEKSEWETRGWERVDVYILRHQRLDYMAS